MRFRSLGKTTPLYTLIVAVCVGLFSLSVSADNMISADQLSRQQLIDSASILSGVTNSGVSDILGVDIVPVVHDIDELSSLTGATDTGSTNSGSTGAIVATPPIDYSQYSYYEGLFTHDGKTYGNSLYPDTLGFDKKIDGVTIYSYDEYLSRQGSIVATDLGKKNQKSSISTKNQKIGNTMMSSSMTALAAPTNGLIAEYLLDGNANDNSLNQYSGTPYMMNWDNYNGRYSAKFGGAGSRIEVNNSLLNGVPQFTINTWITWSDITTAQLRGIFGVQGNYVGNIHYQYISSNGADELVALYIAGTSPSFEHKNIGNINKGQWYMLTTTYNQPTKTISYYLDGVFKGSQTFTNLPTISINSILDIGRVYDTTRYHSGYLDNFRIYNRVLSTSEINDLYNDGSTSPVTNTTSSGYVANYMSSNPLASIDPRYFEQFKTIANTTLSKQNSDEGVIASMFHAAGDPVNLATGEFGYENTLMNIPGIGLPYQLGINYKNQASYNGPLGFNWDHSYNQYLTVEGNGNVLYANGKLGTFRFIKNGSNFVRNEGLRANLVLSGGLYTINYDDGSKASFNTINRISSLSDVAGNTLRFYYTGSYLSSVVDTLGRTINYSYYDHNRLQTVTDFTGRRVDFVYYTGATASGNLYDLQDIILTNSGTTKKISFEYSTGSTETQSHNITKLIDAKRQVYVVNTYDTGDRVATQRYGDGTLTYAYTLSGSAITQNTVLDKLGNRTDYSYDASGNNTSIRYYNGAQTGSVLYSYTYNTGGLVLTETRPRGNGYRYSYDTSGNLSSKRMKANVSLADSAADIVTSYAYNARNEKISETLPNGAQMLYTRDTSGNITQKILSGAIDSAGTVIPSMVTNSTYYSSGLIASTLSPFGRLSQFYYTSGQLTKIVNFTGALTSTGSFTYSPYGTILTATDGDGYTKSYEYSPFDLPTKQTTALGIITTYQYDSNNNKTRESRYLTGGSVTNSYFYYDSLDHLTGSLVDIAPGQSVLTSYLYDANGNVLEKKIGNGSLIKYKYNEFSKVTEERIILVPGNSTEDIVTTYIYDTNNNLVSKTDPRGYTTTYTYDLYDRLTRETDPQGNYREDIYNKDSTISTTSTYTSTGVILTRKSTLYDNYGHITKSTDYLVPATNTGAVEQRYTYTLDFDPSYIYHDSTDVNNRTMITYDLLYFNRKTTFDPMNTTITETFNKRNIKAEEWHSISGGGSIPTWYQYDGDGRLTRVTDNAGKYKSYTYDHLGYVTRTTDEIGRVTDITRDYRGLMLTSTSYSGSTVITTTYTYDERGNMTSITDPMSHTTSYQYDGINRNTKIVYPDLREMIYTYDKNSNLLTKTDPNGTIVTNTYNSLNQLTNRTITRGAGVGGVTSEIYNYDQLGRLISAGDNTNPTGSGVPTYTGSAVTNLTFTYDPLSRLKSETQKPLGGTGYTVGYNYSTIGDLTSITLPDGKIETISYDRAHRPLTITYSGQTIATNLYDRSFLTGTTYGNGRSTSYSYDTLNRLSSINHGSGITNPTYTYNDASDILGDSTKSYTYDSLMRLISATPVATGSMSELYSYDKTGNRIMSSLSTGSTSYTTNTLDQYTTLTGSIYSGSLTYDNNGNIKTQGTRSYTYDYNNRIIEVTIGTGIIAKYSYDTLGRRMSKIDPSSGISTLYIYHGDNIISEYKTTGSLTTRKNYINGIGTDQLIAYDVEESGNQDQIAFCQTRVLPYQGEFTQYGYSNIVNDCNNIQSSATGVTNNLYYYHLNQLGSVIALTDTTGTVLQNYSYDSFGKVYSSNSSNTYSNSRLFTGREYDRETGLYYHRARYYDSDTGRFISRDPIGQNDQVNLYTYVRNSPLMYTDRDGKKASEAIADILDAANDIITKTTSFIDEHRFGFGAGLFYAGGVATSGSAGLCASSVSVTTGCVGVTVVGGPVMAICAPTGVVAGGSCAVAGVGTLMMAKGTQMMAESNGGGSNSSSKQDKQLTNGEIKKLQKGGVDIHEYKKSLGGSKVDMFKDKNGEIYLKRKTGRGTSEPEYLDFNINNF